MRHFGYLAAHERDRLFHAQPAEFTADDDLRLLSVALGATLYSPATRPNLAKDIARRTRQGLTSTVVCLEDAIADSDVSEAERNAVAQLRALAAADDDAPMVFVRVRSAEQIPMIVSGLGPHADVLSGFVLPKFTATGGADYLEAVAAAGRATGRRLLAMPVLESPELIHAESRTGALLAVRDLLDSYRDLVLAVRIGATDFCSAYALRRSRDLTVYDVQILADVIADVVNVFARAGSAGYAVTGPVWEYFPGTERLFKPQLRESPFVEHSERSLRTRLIANDLDGLIREIVLDKANGLTGKTVIHPTHVAAVHALSVVSREEYADAQDIIRTDSGGGARASAYRNKMNESKPHSAWADRILVRAQVFGVANDDVSFVDLLGAGLDL